MSGVFQNNDPPPTARRVCTPLPLVRGEDTLAGWSGGGGSIFWKTPDTSLYSTYASTLCVECLSCLSQSLQRGYSTGTAVYKKESARVPLKSSLIIRTLAST